MVSPDGDVFVKIEIFADADSVAQEAAKFIAAEARAAIGERGRFIMAGRGGHTPWGMLRALGREESPLDNGHFGKAGARGAPNRHPDPKPPHLPENLPEHAH